MSEPVGKVVERLPIKLILPNQGVSRKAEGGGNRREPFVEVTAEIRESLHNQVSSIERALETQMTRLGAAPVRVQLIQKAIAKSHRPHQLFSERTCPIVGAGSLGELFVRATPRGLANLKSELMQQGAQIEKEISSVASLEAITPAFRRKRLTAQDILERCPRRGRNEFIARVRLFDLGDLEDRIPVVDELRRLCREKELRLIESGYSLQGNTFGVACRTVDDIESLSSLVVARSVSGMPLLSIIRGQAHTLEPMPNDLPTAEQVEGEFPSVVVVDSGIAAGIPGLESWIVGRESAVADQYRNSSHGTFVAGLIVWGDRLNPHLEHVSNSPCGIFDLQVLPNWDPEFGDTEGVTEQELLQTLESALMKYAHKFKVWNLSFGTNEVCSESEFSAFAEQLDNLQEQYQVSFVIAAGNYETRPLLRYPRTGDQLSTGRITSPSDSVLGITVGALSHLSYNENGPRKGDPSPFSRHGAGPNYIVKPDLSHFGGTCTLDASHVSGIRSVREGGTGEDLGTSFAAPLVSRSLAHIYHQITPTPQPVLARALLTHHARDLRTGLRVQDGEEDFIGFGIPKPPPYCLSCDSHEATLIFVDSLRPGFFLEWDQFPFPASLRRDGRYFGQISMTVSFAPARGARWGTEYCETHVDAKFGVYYEKTARKTKAKELVFKGLVPPEHKNPGRLYEDTQIRELRKWAPVRTHFGDLGKNGERGERWRLKLSLLTRHGVEKEAMRSQEFALIVTISDPEKKAPVYDEMAQLIRNQYQAENLAVRVAAQIRARPENREE